MVDKHGAPEEGNKDVEKREEERGGKEE